MCDHKPRRHNLVPNAISWKMVALVAVMMALLSRVETDFIARVLEQSKDDAVYQRLRQHQMVSCDGINWRMENDFLFAQSIRLGINFGEMFMMPTG